MKTLFLILFLSFILYPLSFADAADRYADNSTKGGCSNGSTNYNPVTRACSGSTQSTVYFTIEGAYSGLAPGDTIWIRGGGAKYTGTAEHGRVNITGVRGTGNSTRVKLFGCIAGSGCQAGPIPRHRFTGFITIWVAVHRVATGTIIEI